MLRGDKRKECMWPAVRKGGHEGKAKSGHKKKTSTKKVVGKKKRKKRSQVNRGFYERRLYAEGGKGSRREIQ